MPHVAFQDTPKFAYLRHRPFLVIEIYRTPASQGIDRHRTEKRGWMNNPRNVSIEEHPLVVDSVKDRHMCSATVIIDIMRDCVIKNRLDDLDADVLAHYKRKYTNAIERGKNAYGVQKA